MTKMIPKFVLIPEPCSKEAKKVAKFKWASDEIGHRHQMGGEPSFIQSKDWPICPSCKEKMTFYAQLDSIGDDILIADCGMIYVFLCFECLESKSIVQSF